MRKLASMLTVRLAAPADGQAFVSLVGALATFEKLPGPDPAAEARLLEDAFGPRPRFELHVAELGGRVVAYAVTFPTYSTFLARPTLFLEDLFVHPDARRQGVARALMARLTERARELGCGRFEWFVLDWNTDAQTFYDGLGARRLDSWRLCRVTF
jgi:GNAT superfamily N-acetyltransferase